MWRSAAQEDLVAHKDATTLGEALEIANRQQTAALEEELEAVKQEKEEQSAELAVRREHGEKTQGGGCVCIYVCGCVCTWEGREEKCYSSYVSMALVHRNSGNGSRPFRPGRLTRKRARPRHTHQYPPDLQ